MYKLDREEETSRIKRKKVTGSLTVRLLGNRVHTVRC